MSLWFSLVICAPVSDLDMSCCRAWPRSGPSACSARRRTSRDHRRSSRTGRWLPVIGCAVGRVEQRGRRAGGAVGVAELGDPDDLVLLRRPLGEDRDLVADLEAGLLGRRRRRSRSGRPARRWPPGSRRNGLSALTVPQSNPNVGGPCPGCRSRRRSCRRAGRRTGGCPAGGRGARHRLDLGEERRGNARALPAAGRRSRSKRPAALRTYGVGALVHVREQVVERRVRSCR